jgi:hypothetical protein
VDRLGKDDAAGVDVVSGVHGEQQRLLEGLPAVDADGDGNVFIVAREPGRGHEHPDFVEARVERGRNLVVPPRRVEAHCAAFQPAPLWSHSNAVGHRSHRLSGAGHFTPGMPLFEANVCHEGLPAAAQLIEYAQFARQPPRPSREKPISPRPATCVGP